MGHATRCIPIINALIQHNYEPIIASDGVSLKLLKKEFTQIQAIELPSYNISYSKKAGKFKLKMIKKTPQLLKTIRKEKKVVEVIVENEQISGIISDNRFGVRHKDVPSVYITHQPRVLSGYTTWFSSKLHQQIISKFDECWIPDHFGTHNLSGNLGHIENSKIVLKYLGPLSRFEKVNVEKKHDLLVLLSGPEPQRTFLEEKLLSELNGFKGKVVFIKGKIENEQTVTENTNTTIYNFMTSQALEKVINESELILSRSGYTTIMDLAKLEKKAFFIPTPGQSEQEYLAKKFNADKVAPCCNQKDFNISLLNKVNEFTGFKSINYSVNYEDLFNLF